jgi:signal transduction histidine kinase
VRSIVGGALEALHTVRAGHGVELEVDLPAEPLVVLGDKAQLERVLINLVDNGLKFTPPGGRVRVAVDSEIEGFARVVVSDTGMGIPADEVHSVFEQFVRSSRSQERASPGTGLGLAITRSIVELHGGRIWATSGPEPSGTEVVCLLPRAGPLDSPLDGPLDRALDGPSTDLAPATAAAHDHAGLTAGRTGTGRAGS